MHLRPSHARCTGFYHRVGAPATRSLDPSLCPDPMLHRLACAELCREWGTPPESPPFPSRLLSQAPLCEKPLICSISPAFLSPLGAIICFVKPGAPHPPSEDQRTGFSIGIGPVLWSQDYHMY